MATIDLHFKDYDVHIVDRHITAEKLLELGMGAISVLIDLSTEVQKQENKPIVDDVSKKTQ